MMVGLTTGSIMLSDKMFENDIGSALLVSAGFGSYLTIGSDGHLP